MIAAGLTKSQINKAGRIVRRYVRGEIPEEDRVHDALRIMDDYRAPHQYALIKANMGLRSVVVTTGCQVEVSQRLKRFRTIIDKLFRHPNMGLTTMQDIGGCRAVLKSIDEIRRVELRLRRNRPVLSYDDYITTPRASGYRSIHVIVGYDDEHGEERAIEVQLRTTQMHQWAIVVERLSGRLQVDLKSGFGPPPVLAWLAKVSDAMALDELGQTVPEPLLDQLETLRQAALPLLGGHL
jgi:ppGpp synthetase/RelA/SpoT-type nucleotidyltranferase